MNSTEIKKFRLRLTLLTALFTLVFMLVLAKVVELQILDRSRLSEKAADSFKRISVVQGKRGIIFDAAYRELAVTLDVTDIGAHPAKIKATPEMAKAFAQALGVSWRPLYKKLSSKASFTWLKRQAPLTELTAVKALEEQYKLQRRLVYDVAQSRVYPHKQLAGQLIGFVGLDGTGLEGLESFYNRDLKGRKSRITYSKDGKNRKFDLKKKIIADNAGHNVILNIDASIQYIAEEALSKTVSEHRAKSGVAVVLTPKTGAVKAMAHFPLFDPNRFRKYRQQAWRNRIVTDTFEPGSTLKAFTIAAGLESRAASPDTVLDCENGRYYIGRIPIHDTHDYQLLSVSDIVKFSSNIGAAKLGQAMGKEVLYTALKEFGYNRLTGIDCPGEVDGSLNDFRRWRPIDAANIAFGQGIAVTAIQLATAMATIANDGVMMQPQIVQAVTDHNGVVVRKISPQALRRVVSVETARRMQAMLIRVVEKGGTGTRAAVKGFTVGGKTGTAQKIGPDGAYSKRDFISSFVGFVPASRPELVILVVVDEPRKYTYGGLVAAPAFQEIAQSTLNYLNIPMETGPVKIAEQGLTVKKAKL